MEQQTTDRLINSFGSALRPIDTRELWLWLEENMPLPNVYNPQGRFCINTYPYLKRPMIDALDNNIKQINLPAAVQTGKSLLQEVFMPYIILEEPGPLLKIHDTQDNAKKNVEERIIPLLNNNKDIKRLLDRQRFSARKSGIQLPHMTCRISGPAESNLVAYSARYVLGDEIWQWQASHHTDVIEKLKNRQSAFYAIKKMILSSQPDYEGSEWHKQCMAGRWWEYGWRCPDCNTLQLYEWNGEKDGKYYGMIFDKTEEDENEIKDYNKKAESARLVCQHCFHEVKDTPTNRRSLVMDGDYILIHSGNDNSIHSYSWNQFVNISIPFKDIALKYFDAVIQKRTLGLRTKHELFRQQTLGRFWKQGQVMDVRKLMTEAYKSSDSWSEETIRFLTIDVQKDFLYWLVRAWSNSTAESRLIDWGTCPNFNDIEEIITKYKIHPLCVGVDSGANTREVYKETIQHGKVITLSNGKRTFAQWVALRGDGGNSPLSPKKFYQHTIIENGKSIKIDKLYSPVTYVDCQWPANSKFKMFRATLYNWSNYSVKTVLQNLRDHKLPFNWKINERATTEYQMQLHSEELNSKKGRYEQITGVPNHAWDLEAMQLCMSLIGGCFCPSAESMNDIAKAPELIQ